MTTNAIIFEQWIVSEKKYSVIVGTLIYNDMEISWAILVRPLPTKVMSMRLTDVQVKQATGQLP